jgi:hypothetical protein
MRIEVLIVKITAFLDMTQYSLAKIFTMAMELLSPIKVAE